MNTTNANLKIQSHGLWRKLLPAFCLLSLASTCAGCTQAPTLILALACVLGRLLCLCYFSAHVARLNPNNVPTLWSLRSCPARSFQLQDHARQLHKKYCHTRSSLAIFLPGKHAPIAPFSMASPPGDADTSTAGMAQSPPGDPLASRNPDATPIRNGETHLNGDTRNGSRASSSSPEQDASHTNDGSDDSTTPRLSRKPSRKAARREPPLFNDAPDVTEEAIRTFQVIDDCLYGSKNMAAAGNDAFDCDCSPELSKNFPGLALLRFSTAQPGTNLRPSGRQYQPRLPG